MIASSRLKEFQVGPATSTTLSTLYSLPGHASSGERATGLSGAFASLVRAAVRAEQDHFQQPDPIMISRAVELIRELSGVFPAEVGAAAVSVGPDGSITLVVSFGAFDRLLDGPAASD